MGNINKERIIKDFRALSLGVETTAPYICVSPSQPDDGKNSRSFGSIEVFELDDRLIILHGNHRYYDLKRKITDVNKFTIYVRKAKNPYIDY